MKEIWKKIKEYENYEVSNTGHVRNGIKLQSQKNGFCGYKTVILYNNKNIKTFFIHKLVADAFLPNNDINKTIVDHINNKRDDNRIENLIWITPSQYNINSLLSFNKKTDYKGFFFKEDLNKWTAYITINGKYINGGDFKKKKEQLKNVKNLKRNIMINMLVVLYLL